jgi:hypothetical protein
MRAWRVFSALPRRFLLTHVLAEELAEFRARKTMKLTFKSFARSVKNGATRKKEPALQSLRLRLSLWFQSSFFLNLLPKPG